MQQEIIARKQIVEIGRRMHKAGMAPGQDGNISVRLNENEILITPSRVPKGYMTESQMVKLDLNGDKISGELSPSVESIMHLMVYREYKNIGACIHSHPLFIIVLSMAGIKLSTKVLPEIATVFGSDIPVANYVTPGTRKMGEVLLPGLKDSKVVIQERHGLFSTGKSLFEAWYLSEQIESCAKILYYANTLNAIRELPDDEINRLIACNKSLPKTPEEIFG